MSELRQSPNMDQLCLQYSINNIVGKLNRSVTICIFCLALHYLACHSLVAFVRYLPRGHYSRAPRHLSFTAVGNEMIISFSTIGVQGSRWANRILRWIGLMVWRKRVISWWTISSPPIPRGTVVGYRIPCRSRSSISYRSRNKLVSFPFWEIRTHTRSGWWYSDIVQIYSDIM